jgi:hypothetical protein
MIEEALEEETKEKINKKKDRTVGDTDKTEE